MSVSVWYKGQLDATALKKHYDQVSVENYEIELGDTENTINSIGLASTLQKEDKEKLSDYFKNMLGGDGKYLVLFKKAGS